MRVNFTAAGVPTRAAKRLKQQLGVKESLARAATAYVLGYRDWHELASSIGTAAPSPLDEECDTTALQARRAYQLARLVEFGESADLEGEPDMVLKLWQPSAGRPQEPLTPVPAKSRALNGEMNSLLGELLDLEPDLRGLQVRVAAQLPALLEMLHTVRHHVVPECLFSVASTLIQASDAQAKRLGRTLLEAVAARDHPPAMLNLATALRFGDGGPVDLKRAGDLLERLVASTDVEERVLIHAQKSLADLHAEGAGGRAVRKDKALALWEAAALRGDPTGAFNVGLM